MSKSGTIAFVSLEIYPTTAGGVGILLSHTIRYLLSEGYEIVLLLDIQQHEFEQFARSDRMEFENGSNLHVYHVDELCEDEVFPDTAIPHPEILRSARLAAALEKICARHDVEMVEFYDYCGPAYSFLANTLPNPPAIAVRLHNTIELIARKIRSALDPERVVQFAAERTALRGADLVLSSGQLFYEREIAPLYPEIAPERVEVSPPLHSPVGMIEYAPLACDVVFYGRLSTFKGLDIFIKGAVMALRDPQFSDWLGKFIIIGPEETVASTYSLEDMKGFIPDELKDRFTFAGRVDHPTLMRHLEGTAFACFANRMESFCYAAHELHTAGIPLILSDTATFRDHFEEGETALFFDRSPTGLAERMIELSQDRLTRVALSRTGQARIPRYLADYYGGHLASARKRRTERQDARVRPGVLILSDGDAYALQHSLAALAGGEGLLGNPMVLTLDETGSFQFAGQRWRLETPAGEPVNGALTRAPEAMILLRAGDTLEAEWLGKAAQLMGRRPDVGAVSGWLRNNSHISMGNATLLPEAANHAEPGLRCLIRLNPRDTLQDALMSRPHDSEGAMLLDRRARGLLTLTLSGVSCDVSRAVNLPRPALQRALAYDFDRYSRDHLALLLEESGALEALDTQGNRQALLRSRRERGFFNLRAIPRDDNGEDGELLLLRFFPERGKQPATWDALQLEGNWALRRDPGGPVAGALRTISGQAAGYLREGAAIDVITSPWSGQIEITYAGRQKTFDLKKDHVAPLRIIFDHDGIRARLLAAGNNNLPTPAGLALHDAPTRFLETGRCETLVLCATRDDLRHWPAQEVLAGRMVQATPELFRPDQPGGPCPLTALVGRAGTTRLILSSRLEPDPMLSRALSSLPRHVELGLALCGPRPTDDHGLTRLAQIATWYRCLSPYFARLCCLGGPQGILEMFASAGAKPLAIPPLLPVTAPNSAPADAPVSLALLPAEQQPHNLMHMFNAALLAVGAGLKLDKVYIPEGFRDELLILDELHLPLSLEFFTDSAGLAFAGTGTRRVAMACYPQEQIPAKLAEAASFGWLPLAGATTDLDNAPGNLAQHLTEPYWENAALLADRLVAACSDHAALCTAYATHAAHSHKLAHARLTAYVGQGCQNAQAITTRETAQ